MLFVKKINCNIYALKRVSTAPSEVFLLNINYGIIYFHLNCGIEIWGCAAAKHITRLLTIQRKIIKVHFWMKKYSILLYFSKE